MLVRAVSKKFLNLQLSSQRKEEDLVIILGLCEYPLCLQMHCIKIMVSEALHEAFLLFTKDFFFPGLYQKHLFPFEFPLPLNKTPNIFVILSICMCSLRKKK